MTKKEREQMYIELLNIYGDYHHECKAFPSYFSEIVRHVNRNLFEKYYNWFVDNGYQIKEENYSALSQYGRYTATSYLIVEEE